MWYYTLVTLDRRAGHSFQLKTDNGRTVIGTMAINGSTGHHEMELPEADFLRHSKALAVLGKMPGCAVYVAKVREVPDALPAPPPAVPAKAKAKAKPPIPIRAPLPADTRYHRITQVARQLGLDLTSCTTNKERIEKINAIIKIEHEALGIAA